MVDKPYIYVASSWRNERQQEVVKALRYEGYPCYDFRQPNGQKGFAWSDVPVNTTEVHNTEGDTVAMVYDWNRDACTPEEFLAALQHPLAVNGFRRDFEALQRAEILVLVLPCERDAHMELGWAAGVGKETIVLLDDPCKASLMYQLVDHMCSDIESLIDWLRED